MKRPKLFALMVVLVAVLGVLVGILIYSANTSGEFPLVATQTESDDEIIYVPESEFYSRLVLDIEFLPISESKYELVAEVWDQDIIAFDLKFLDNYFFDEFEPATVYDHKIADERLDTGERWVAYVTYKTKNVFKPASDNSGRIVLGYFGTAEPEPRINEDVVISMDMARSSLSTDRYNVKLMSGLEVIESETATFVSEQLSFCTGGSYLACNNDCQRNCLDTDDPAVCAKLCPAQCEQDCANEGTPEPNYVAEQRFVCGDNSGCMTACIAGAGAGERGGNTPDKIAMQEAWISGCPAACASGEHCVGAGDVNEGSKREAERIVTTQTNTDRYKTNTNQVLQQSASEVVKQAATLPETQGQARSATATKVVTESWSPPANAEQTGYGPQLLYKYPSTLPRQYQGSGACNDVQKMFDQNCDNSIDNRDLSGATLCSGVQSYIGRNYAGVDFSGMTTTNCAAVQRAFTSGSASTVDDLVRIAGLDLPVTIQPAANDYASDGSLAPRCRCVDSDTGSERILTARIGGGIYGLLDDPDSQENQFCSMTYSAYAYHHSQGNDTPECYIGNARRTALQFDGKTYSGPVDQGVTDDDDYSKIMNKCSCRGQILFNKGGDIYELKSDLDASDGFGIACYYSIPAYVEDIDQHGPDYIPECRESEVRDWGPDPQRQQIIPTDCVYDGRVFDFNSGDSPKYHIDDNRRYEITMPVNIDGDSTIGSPQDNIECDANLVEVSLSNQDDDADYDVVAECYCQQVDKNVSASGPGLDVTFIQETYECVLPYNEYLFYTSNPSVETPTCHVIY